MSNDITGKFFDHQCTKEEATELLMDVAREVGFTPEREIFCGKIYDADKVGSLIYAGTWQGKRAVLKLQILELAVAEQDILRSVADVLKGTNLRVPEVYAAEAWDRTRGYGYLLLEEILGTTIYRPPLASPAQQREFCALYTTLATIQPRPLLPQTPLETNAATFTLRRMFHWMQIGEGYAPLTSDIVEQMGRFTAHAAPLLHGTPMRYMHGHLSMDDILQGEEGGWVLMSNLFWSYRPMYYDATFHLWAGIKASRDLTLTLETVVAYLEDWCAAYATLPGIAEDPLFRPRFWVMMAERALSAQMIDIYAQTYQEKREEHIAHLRGIFTGIFNWSLAQLQKT